MLTQEQDGGIRAFKNRGWSIELCGFGGRRHRTRSTDPSRMFVNDWSTIRICGHDADQQGDDVWQ